MKSHPSSCQKHPRCQRCCFEASASRNTKRHFPEISELTASGSEHIAKKQCKVNTINKYRNKELTGYIYIYYYIFIVNICFPLFFPCKKNQLKRFFFPHLHVHCQDLFGSMACNAPCAAGAVPTWAVCQKGVRGDVFPG